MKKFVFLYYGAEEHTPEAMQAWNEWFSGFKDKLSDFGTPFSRGIEVNHSGAKELADGQQAITGYSIVSANDIEEALEIAKKCPFFTAIRVYESAPMNCD